MPAALQLSVSFFTLFSFLPLLSSHLFCCLHSLLHASASASHTFHPAVTSFRPLPLTHACRRGSCERANDIYQKCFFRQFSPAGKRQARFAPTETTPADCSHVTPCRRPSSQDQRKLKGSPARRPRAIPLNTHRRPTIPHFCTVRRLLGRQHGEARAVRSILFTRPADGGTKRG